MEEILQWIFLVLAAGFVGYFGRYLAMRLIRRLGAEKNDSRQNRGPSLHPGADNAGLDKKKLKSLAKREKKRLKAEKKKEKS